jgi:transposase-like protein
VVGAKPYEISRGGDASGSATHFADFLPTTLTMATITKTLDLELAIADLECQEKPNYRAIARKYGVSDVTLRRRFLGTQVSPATASSLYRQRLSAAQETALIAQINQLTSRGIPPTSQMVKNMAEEMIQDTVGKNWTGEFVRRHQDVLKSVYLRNIDKQRAQAEYLPTIAYFFELVLSFPYLTALN